MNEGRVTDNMTVAFLVLLGFLAFLIFALWQFHKQKKYRMEKIRRTYGQWPEREYGAEEYEAISHYFQHRQTKEKEVVIDDITWNDLDMDRIFMLLNHTWSCIGESYLYSMLRTPVLDEEILKERNRLTEYFMAHPKEREDMEYRFAKIGKTGRQSVFDYIYNLAELPVKPLWPHLAWIGAEILGFCGIFINAAYGMLIFLAAIAGCWYSYYQERKQIEPYVISCSCLVHILKMAESFEKVDAPEFAKYRESIISARKSFKKLKRNTLFLVGRGNGDGPERMLLDYLNYTFHLDIIQFNTVIRELGNHMGDLEALIDAVGMLECATAIASFRKLMEKKEGWCIPELHRDEKLYVKAEEIYHPLIADPVKNSITAKRGVLLTGSNASGKSTFLKTVAINAILAQTVYTCMAKKWEGNYFQIYTSMALRDDLESQESYFIVEIKSLKRILDHADGKIPMLCFVDEVLRGTNTVERIAASSEILESMERPDVMCFAATHDIELTHILEEGYDNYHFQEEVSEEAVLFNYQLYPGRAVSRNAIKLLKVMGYDNAIIDKAEQMAEHFLARGEWR